MSAPPTSALLHAVHEIAAAVAAETMRFYGRTDHATKSDGSPVTLADAAAERIILAGLRDIDPAIPIVSEEAHAAGEGPELAAGQTTFWLVDPLDGTREFLSRNGEFTVNIALIEHGTPVLGVVVAPAIGETYLAHGPGTARLVRDGGISALRVRNPPEAGLTVVASRSHGDAEALDRFLAGRRVASLRPAGSSLKLCLVASGEADLYPRLGTTMEWDIAAGHAVLLAAGGTVALLDGQPLRYGKPGFRNPHFCAHAARP